MPIKKSDIKQNDNASKGAQLPYATTNHTTLTKSSSRTTSTQKTTRDQDSGGPAKRKQKTKGQDVVIQSQQEEADAMFLQSFGEDAQLFLDSDPSENDDEHIRIRNKTVSGTKVGGHAQSEEETVMEGNAAGPKDYRQKFVCEVPACEYEKRFENETLLIKNRLELCNFLTSVPKEKRQMTVSSKKWARLLGKMKFSSFFDNCKKSKIIFNDFVMEKLNERQVWTIIRFDALLCTVNAGIWGNEITDSKLMRSFDIVISNMTNIAVSRIGSTFWSSIISKTLNGHDANEIERLYAQLSPQLLELNSEKKLEISNAYDLASANCDDIESQYPIQVNQEDDVSHGDGGRGEPDATSGGIVNTTSVQSGSQLSFDISSDNTIEDLRMLVIPFRRKVPTFNEVHLNEPIFVTSYEMKCWVDGNAVTLVQRVKIPNYKVDPHPYRIFCRDNNTLLLDPNYKFKPDPDVLRVLNRKGAWYQLPDTEYHFLYTELGDRFYVDINIESDVVLDVYDVFGLIGPFILEGDTVKEGVELLRIILIKYTALLDLFVRYLQDDYPTVLPSTTVGVVSTEPANVIRPNSQSSVEGPASNAISNSVQLVSPIRTEKPAAGSSNTGHIDSQVISKVSAPDAVSDTGQIDSHMRTQESVSINATHLSQSKAPSTLNEEQGGVDVQVDDRCASPAGSMSMSFGARSPSSSPRDVHDGGLPLHNSDQGRQLRVMDTDQTQNDVDTDRGGASLIRRVSNNVSPRRSSVNSKDGRDVMQSRVTDFFRMSIDEVARNTAAMFESDIKRIMDARFVQAKNDIQDSVVDLRDDVYDLLRRKDDLNRDIRDLLYFRSQLRNHVTDYGVTLNEMNIECNNLDEERKRLYEEIYNLKEERFVHISNAADKANFLETWHQELAVLKLQLEAQSQYLLEKESELSTKERNLHQLRVEEKKKNEETEKLHEKNAKKAKCLDDKTSEIEEALKFLETKKAHYKSTIQLLNQQKEIQKETMDSLYNERVKILETSFTEKHKELETSFAQRNAELESSYNQRNKELETLYTRNKELESIYVKRNLELETSFAERNGALESQWIEREKASSRREKNFDAFCKTQHDRLIAHHQNVSAKFLSGISEFAKQIGKNEKVQELVARLQSMTQLHIPSFESHLCELSSECAAASGPVISNSGGVEATVSVSNNQMEKDGEFNSDFHQTKKNDSSHVGVDGAGGDGTAQGQ